MHPLRSTLQTPLGRVAAGAAALLTAVYLVR